MRVLVGLIAFMTIGPAYAGAQGDPEQGCNGASTPEIVDCLNAHAAQWDKEMTVAYQQAFKDAGSTQRERLRAAQRLWIQYRDANCLYYAMGEGTAARIEAAECRRRMTESRARELRGETAGPDNPGKEDRD